MLALLIALGGQERGGRVRDSQDSFIGGAAILGAAGIIAKLIGALYRIPIANILGAEGSGYYGMAYPVYSALAAISTVGIPTAISQIIAQRLGREDLEGAARIYAVSHRFLLILGCVLTGTFLALAPALAQVVQAKPATAAFCAIAPAFLFVCLVSCYRGVLQGFERMGPTAMSQVVEQLGKLGFGLTAALAVMRTAQSPALGAAAALGGIAVSELVTLLYIRAAYARSSAASLAHHGLRADRTTRSEDLKQLLRVAVPVTVGACIMPLILSLDALLVSPALQSAGATQVEAASQAGLLSMNVEPLVNLPTALSAALAMSVVPSLAQAFSEGKIETCAEQATLAMKLALCVALPCASGLALLAEPIMALLFGSLDQESLHMAGQLLQIMSIGVVFLVLAQTATGILQGVEHQNLPVIGLVVGAAVKIVGTLALVPAIGMPGAAWASVLCFGAAFASDAAFMKKHVRRSSLCSAVLIRIVFSTAIMTAAAGGVFYCMEGLSGGVATICAVLAGALVYVALLCRTRCVARSEFQALPGGDRMVRWMDRLHLWPQSRRG